MTTAIVQRTLTPDVWTMIERIAPTMKDARLFGVATPAQAQAIMTKGYELGLSLTASFDFICVISDRPSLIPRGALALILNSPECAGLKIDDQADDKGNPTACTVWMKRRNGLEYTVKFTMKDAERADLVKTGGGWTKYPANMLRWRAIGFCADVVFPDVLGGMKRADELGADLTPDGEVITGSWTVVEQNKPLDSIPALLNELVNQHGAAKIMELNGGKIPTTRQEMLAVDAKLNKENGGSPEFTMADVVEMAPA